nr:MAG TPA: repressor domain protein [Bacteriophage sp.]
MNELQTFNFNNQPVRTVQLNNQPYWVLKDVCDVLELSNPTVVANRLEDDERAKFNLGRQGEATVITESGLYAVILRSDKPNAKEFRKWVTSEVLPAIRKHGAYATPQTIEQMINNPDFTIQLLTELKKERESVNLLAATVKEYEPKVSYYDKILKNKSLMNTTVIAQDYGMSASAFNKKLHELRIQHKVGDQWILYVEHQGNGYVHSDPFIFTDKDGNNHITQTTKWTQKGRLFLYDKLKAIGILPSIEKS